MNVGVDKLKSIFLNKVEDSYNADMYFIGNCSTSTRYSLSSSLLDTSLQLYFEKNNYIILNGQICRYIDPSVKRTIKLKNISVELGQPELDIVNNYIIEDKWEQIDW